MNKLEQTPEAVLNEALKHMDYLELEIAKGRIQDALETFKFVERYIKHAQSLIKEAGAK